MEEDFVKHVEHLVIQLAVILAAAKIGGEICERYLKIPTVLGELSMGALIGPFALGGVAIFGLGPLFSIGDSRDALPVSLELFSISQLAAVVLLFAAGLETDLKQFRRYAAPASLVAIGGVVAPFALGAGVTMLLKPAGLDGDALLYAALFMGAIMTATSVGITARVLGDMHRLDSPEGVTIMAAAVVDDVLGILVLTVVVGIATPGEELTASGIALIGAKAVGFWLALMIGGILASKYISRAFESFRVSGASVALAMALALLASGLAESFGLAMIIGAYSVGLALSDTQSEGEDREADYGGAVPRPGSNILRNNGDVGGRERNGWDDCLQPDTDAAGDCVQGGWQRSPGPWSRLHEGGFSASRHRDASTWRGSPDNRRHRVVPWSDWLGLVRRVHPDDRCNHIHGSRPAGPSLQKRRSRAPRRFQ